MATTPLAGLTNLYGGRNPEEPRGVTGRPASDWGTSADSRHAQPGDTAHEKNTRGTSYGPDTGVPVYGTESITAIAPGGFVYDHTPTSHAAPFPAGLQQDLTVYAEQSRALHGNELGASIRHTLAPTPYPEHFDSGRYDSPDETDLAGSLPGQLRSGQAAKDRAQGFGTANNYGFSLGRQFRRWAKDPIPLDRTGVISNERPFWGKHPVSMARFDGQDSPFAHQGDTTKGMNIAPTPVGYSTPYVAPPNPTVLPEVGYDESPIVGADWLVM